MMQEIHARFYGHVHGVGFRAQTEAIAKELHLTGFVRNCKDDSVEIYAQGDKKDLDSLISQLKEAFTGKIKDCKVEYYEPKEMYNGFQVQV